MPTFNDEDYLQRSIDSVLSQENVDFELIIVDDGSTDSTPQILSAVTDARVCTFRQSNADQLNALLNGAKYASGDVIMLLHSDDLLADLTTLQRLRQLFFKNPEIEGAYADLLVIDEDDRFKGRLKAAKYKPKCIIGKILKRFKKEV